MRYEKLNIKYETIRNDMKDCNYNVKTIYNTHTYITHIHIINI